MQYVLDALQASDAETYNFFLFVIEGIIERRVLQSGTIEEYYYDNWRTLWLIVNDQKAIATPGRGILAMDESNATCGLRLASIGLENTEVNRQAYRQLLVGTPGLGEYISGAILFEETLYQSTTDGQKMVDVLSAAGIVPGIKVDKVL